MKKAILIIFVLIYSSISFAYSDILDRLAVIANSNGAEILVDQFINGTEDYYVATIVKPISTVEKGDLTKAMTDIIDSFEDESDIYLRELNAYSKKEQSFVILQRSLVRKPYYETSVYPEIYPNPEIITLKDGTVEKEIWEAIAGEKGLGYTLLSDDHEPVEINDKKEVIDADRYILTARRDGIGVYVDKKSFVKTSNGCIAWIIEPISPNNEDAYGELITNITGMPFQKINLMMIKTEFDFSRPVCKTLRYIYFSKDNKILYSSLSANTEEINVSMDASLNTMYNFVKDMAPDILEK